MQYRIDKKSGNKLSILGFGCMRFPSSKAKTEKMIINSIKKGVNYFDTAYIYPNSEETLGAILKKNKLREKIYIATKLPLMVVNRKEDFDKYFAKQLERLQTEYIDYYLMHSINDSDQWKAMCDLGIEKWIKTKQKEGKIKQVGFSFHGNKTEFLKVLDMYDWDFCQIQYNYSDINYQAGITGLKAAYKKNIPVIIMEPLLGGKLVTGLPNTALELLKKADTNTSPAAWALKWLWNQEECTVVLSGMSEASQVNENIEVASTSKPNMFSKKEKETFIKVTKLFNETNKINCTGCGYCDPCPMNVNIPACFSAYNTSYSIGYTAGIKNYAMSTGATGTKLSSASLCMKCRKCEIKCPQKIEISKELIQVKKRLEPFWYRIVVSLVRKVLKKNKSTKNN